MLKQRIGFVGAGQMATALGRGFVEAGMIAAENLLASDPAAMARQRFAEVTGGRTVEENTQVVAEGDVLFLAVKPQQIAPVTAQLKGRIGSEKLVVSIAAGVRLDTLSNALGTSVRLVRVMPNTPCLVGCGACGYSLGRQATAPDGQLVEQLLGAVGIACEVDEILLDAVTGLSGSGPAFVYTVIEALSDGGVRMGLPRDIATRLAAATVRGAAEMVTATGEHTGVLKDRVCSPGGTTIAGIQALESGGLRAALMAAVETATRRSIELGKA
ncbi:MAG: pyrroline-5-carboxylate reductase [Planctomycetes bacterium RBG_13_63_9]|nr:MAG: pyrroline-5-carboxylate reductase [Planctomycetes bacterium RBG_13_63_9]